jgi:hypothetical protein
MARKRGEQPWILVLAFRGNKVHCLKYLRRPPAGREKQTRTLFVSPLRAPGRTPHCLVLISRGGEGGGGGRGGGGSASGASSQSHAVHNAKILKEVMEIYPAPEFLCHYSTSS